MENFVEEKEIKIHEADDGSSCNSKFLTDLGNEASKNARIRTVTLYEVYEMLGIASVIDEYDPRYNDAKTWGWSPENPKLHHLTTKELHPEGCPCCGRPW